MHDTATIYCISSDISMLMYHGCRVQFLIIKNILIAKGKTIRASKI
jgi:hypothetical protein